MPLRPKWFPATALLCTVLLVGSLSHPPAAADEEVAAADPPVLVTNLSGDPVELQWQTVHPNVALSPARGALVPAAATDAVADRGLFWFYDSANGGTVENVVFVSIVDADGAILTQVVMDEEIAGTLETVEETALHITIELDGTLTLAIQDAG